MQRRGGCCRGLPRKAGGPEQDNAHFRHTGHISPPRGVNFSPGYERQAAGKRNLPCPAGGRRFTSESRAATGKPSSALIETAITSFFNQMGCCSSLLAASQEGVQHKRQRANRAHADRIRISADL